MKHIFGNMKKYWITVAVIFVLLIAQAFFDFSLPDYTSHMIDTGIAHSGIEYATPEEITAQSYLGISSIMTSEELELWNQVYEVEEDGNYKLKEGEDQATLDDTFLKPIAAYAILVSMSTSDTSSQEAGSMTMEELRQTIDDKLDEMGDTIIQTYAAKFTEAEYKALGIDTDKIRTDYLTHKGILMIIYAFAMMGISVIVGLLASRVGSAIGRDLRRDIFTKVINFSDAEVGKFSSASLITRTTNDIQQVQMVTILLLRMILYAPILAIGGIYMVILTGAGMEYIIVIAVAAIILLMGTLIIIAMPKFKAMQKLVDRVNLVSREILTGLSVIRAFSREDHEEQRFDVANKDLTKVMLFTNRVMSFMMPMLMIIMNGLSILIVWTAAHRINDGVMGVGAMTAFITYTMMIVMSFLMLTMVSIMLPRAGVAADRIHEVLVTESTLTDKENPQDLSHMKGVVAFHHVNFRYPEAEENVLTDIDFEARPGTITAIIGSTGCGKSSLVNLIPRFFDVSEGSITIDDVDIRDAGMQSLRSRIGYVPQKGVLFSGTIESNIKYGQKVESDQIMEEAAVIAQASDFIAEKNDGFQSQISQGGSNVSGGQKQRLSIARAIARDPMIYIFDDSFSALDFRTDIALRKALGPKTKDRTVFIVAQRISTILHADQILVLEDGQLAGKGTHKELMENCEVYKQIATSQLSEKELTKSLEEV